MLAWAGWNFSVLVADVDESQLSGEAPGDYVLRLAERKARKVAEKAGVDKVILAADTDVVDAGEILSKPVDEQDAVRMLKRLRGHTHQVYTGLAVLRTQDMRLLTDLTVTHVLMRAYSDQEIETYVHSGDPLDKAGAYGIQHPGFQPVENLQGCFASVMGLPVCRLTGLLEQFELAPESSATIRCQVENQTDCQLSSATLRGELVSSQQGET